MNLESQVRKLILLNESESFVVSCYIDNSDLAEGYREDLESRVLQIKPLLSPDQQDDFEQSLNKILEYLSSAVAKKSKGIALFVRSGKVEFFESILFDLPFKTHISIDTIPHLYQLLLMKDTYDKYVVLISEESYARIVEVSIGKVTKELWTEKPELRLDSGKGWTRQHYQNHKKDRKHKFLKEKIKILDQLFTEGRHNHLILAGNKLNIQQIKELLPKRLIDKLVDQVTFSGRSSTEEVIGASLSVFADYERKESIDRAQELLNEVKKGGLAVVGVTDSYAALQQGRVDLLVMADGISIDGVLKCNDCSHVETKADSKVCSTCGGEDLMKVNFKEEVVLLARQMSTTIEILRESDELNDVGGIGCLLRF
jgi:peptide subunit release factor 1 (eRF1)